MNEYENVRRVAYTVGDEGDAVFVPVCEKCGRFVKADDVLILDGRLRVDDTPNATCKKDGRVAMVFEGFF